MSSLLWKGYVLTGLLSEELPFKTGLNRIEAVSPDSNHPKAQNILQTKQNRKTLCNHKTCIPVSIIAFG